MNFGWFNDDTAEYDFSGTILHEFGHALGCIHKHLSPASDIQWNKPAVYDYYSKLDPPWSKEEIDENTFNKYSSTITQYTEFDKKSIMLYAISNSLTLNDFEVGWNDSLSDTDKSFINKVYPFIKEKKLI